MKKTLFIISALVCGLSLQSCLDFDDPGDELNSTTQKGGQVGSNAINHIDYDRPLTLQTLENAMNALNSDANMPLPASKSAQFCLRGGKDGNVPGAHAYQYQYCLETDAYCGYAVVSHNDFPYSNATLPTSYSIDLQFLAGPRGNYGSVKNFLMPLLRSDACDSIPELKAINLLYFCLAAQECADISGPFTYLEDKENSEDPREYNTMGVIYESIVQDLDTIVACLDYYKVRGNRPDEYRRRLEAIVAEFCQTTYWDLPQGDAIESFRRLANSLKLRMAMHIVKVEPALAKKWAEEAVASGVIESEITSHALWPSRSGFTNPLNDIWGPWADSRLCASFESILMSLDHPYVHENTVYDEEGNPVLNQFGRPMTKTFLFQKNANEIACNDGTVLAPDSAIVGIRAGQRVGVGQSAASNAYCSYSSMDDMITGMAPLYLIKYSEVLFLRAEGALRGWNMGGSAKDFYEEGIRHASLDEPSYRAMYKDFGIVGYNDMVEEYLTRTAPIPYTHRDPIDGSTIESVTKIGVAWNDADSQETKLEKIITQKYIALFPDSHEAWADLRRTGYPKLFPVLNATQGDGSIKNGNPLVQDASNIMRRVPWMPTDEIGKDMVANSGLRALGNGVEVPDQQGTRLWWDVDAPNF